jgi:transposase InsO family protein
LTTLANGCIERFFRTLKEQLLWIRRFRSLAELREALQSFRHRYNHQWIVERLGYQTPVQARLSLAPLETPHFA